MPRLDRIGVAELESIPGRPPDLIHRPWGCAFAPRCAVARADCTTTPPSFHRVAAGHAARCHLVV